MAVGDCVFLKQLTGVKPSKSSWNWPMPSVNLMQLNKILQFFRRSFISSLLFTLPPGFPSSHDFTILRRSSIHNS